MLPADLVVVAIGHDPDLSTAGALEREEDGTLRIDPETGQTSMAGVFAGGDLASGARTVTQAIGAGQRGAWGIDAALRGRKTAESRRPPPKPDGWASLSRRDHAPPRDGGFGERQAPAPRRTVAFDELHGSLSETQAQAEAARCMVCGQCGNCRACLDLFGCPAFHLDPASSAICIDTSLCDGCGQCADLCPNGAIRAVRSES